MKLVIRYVGRPMGKNGNWISGCGRRGTRGTVVGRQLFPGPS